MRALLLSAGFGTRLRPLTNAIPKCLVPIKGEPLMGMWLKKLIEFGVDSILVNTHYLADVVEEYIRNTPYVSKVNIVNEPILLGTAGTLNANLDFFGDEEGFLIHADNLCLEDLNAFYNAHLSRPKSCLMTMMTFRTKTPANCGIIELDDQGVVINFYEKQLEFHGNLANGAIYILSKELLKEWPKKFQNANDFSADIIPSLMGKIFTFETKNSLIDIGTPESYIAANN